MAEDAAVLLVAARVGGDLAQLDAVGGIRRRQDGGAPIAGQSVLDRRERLLRLAVLQANAGHHAHALRLDVDLALGVGVGADRARIGVVGAQEPLAVPAGGFGGLLDLRHGLAHGRRLGGSGVRGHAAVSAEAFEDLGILAAVQHEHAGDEHRFGHARVVVLHGLEALAGLGGEAVEVQAVVPVGAADQRQAVRAAVLHREVHRTAQMLEQRLLGAFRVVERHRFVQDAGVAGFGQVSEHRGDQPQRIVVEAAADVRVAALG